MLAIGGNMATIPHVPVRGIVRARHQNLLIDQVNLNTAEIEALKEQGGPGPDPGDGVPSTDVDSTGLELVRRAVDGQFVRGFDPGTTEVWVPFFGPDSGVVKVSVSARRSQTVSLQTWVGWEIREGFEPGEGTLVTEAHKTRSAVAPKSTGIADISGEFETTVQPGQPYHARLMWASENWSFPETGSGVSLLTRQIQVLPIVGLTPGEVQGMIDASLTTHVNAAEPHKAYDIDMPSLSIIFENGLV